MEILWSTDGYRQTSQRVLSVLFSYAHETQVPLSLIRGREVLQVCIGEKIKVWYNIPREQSMSPECPDQGKHVRSSKNQESGAAEICQVKY